MSIFSRVTFLLTCAFVLVSFSAPDGKPGKAIPENRSGRELFYSDSLNALARTRPYPVPDVEYTPAPKGYKPVYISSYARHGSRRIIRIKEAGSPIKVLAKADSVGCLTPLGKEVLTKLKLIRKDAKNTLGELTQAGVRQHRGIAERMCQNYPNVFSNKGTQVRLYSTPIQRTMLSMFACNEEIMRHYPKASFTRQSSTSMKYLKDEYENPQKIGSGAIKEFLRDYFDVRPFCRKLFTEDAPALKDTIGFLNNLYSCGGYVQGLDMPEADYLWDVFTHEELFTLQQALNYRMYIIRTNSPQLGDLVMNAIKPLLKDFVDKADIALKQDVPGVDLRFGHDTGLIPLNALIGVNGPVVQVDDPLKVIDTLQDFISAPMAGNLQMVFYRNHSGDVLVKFLQNEVEAWIPIDTDLYPYYHWNDVRNYFNSLIGD